MGRKRHAPEQIIRKLREAEFELGRGMKTPEVRAVSPRTSSAFATGSWHSGERRSGSSWTTAASFRAASLRSLGVSSRRAHRLLPAGEADGQQVRRELQRLAARRVPERALGRNAGGSDGEDRPLEGGLQRESASPGSRGAGAGGIRRAGQGLRAEDQATSRRELTPQLDRKTKPVQAREILSQWLVRNSEGTSGPSALRSAIRQHQCGLVGRTGVEPADFPPDFDAGRVPTRR